MRKLAICALLVGAFLCGCTGPIAPPVVTWEVHPPAWIWGEWQVVEIGGGYIFAEDSIIMYGSGFSMDMSQIYADAQAVVDETITDTRYIVSAFFEGESLGSYRFELVDENTINVWITTGALTLGPAPYSKASW